MVAKGLAHEVGLLEGLDGLAQVARKPHQPGVASVLLIHVQAAAVVLLRKRELLLNALETSGDRGRNGKVGVGSGVRIPQLDAGGRVLAGLVRGNANQRGAVATAPGCVDGNLAVGLQTLVGVDRRVGDQRVLGRILQNARDVVAREVRHMEGVLAPEEVLAIVVEERLVQEHGRARGASDGLGHEGGKEVVLVGLLLDDQTRRHDCVGGAHRLGIAQLDSVLGGSVGVIGVLYGDGHLLERERGGTAQVTRRVVRRQVEVAGVVHRHWLGTLSREVEVLNLGAHVGHEALLVRHLEHTVQAPAGVAVKGLARRRPQVAEDARHARVARTPRQDLERLRVRERQHVRLVRRRKAVNRGPVEANALIKCLLELLRRDRERLEVALNVREPQPDEANVSLLDRA